MMRISVADMALGSAAAAAAIFCGVGLASCGPATLMQCRVEAVKVLPEDPGQITPYDLVDVVKRLQACKTSADAGR